MYIVVWVKGITNPRISRIENQKFRRKKYEKGKKTVLIYKIEKVRG
jgi:hypothetical protein